MLTNFNDPLVPKNIKNISVMTLFFQALYLNDNDITHMSSDAIKFLLNATTLQNLTLEANPWDCDCQAYDFFNFIQVKHRSNSELRKVKCNGYDSFIYKMKPQDFCPS